MRIVACLLFVGAMLAVTSLSTAQPPQRQPGQPGKGTVPGRGFGGITKPGQVFSEGLQERLKLSEAQKKQVADLQKDVDEKIAKILTDEQKEQLKAMSGRGGRGPGAGGFPGRGEGKGGFPGKGGPGGKGGFPGKGKREPAPMKDSR